MHWVIFLGEGNEKGCDDAESQKKNFQLLVEHADGLSCGIVQVVGRDNLEPRLGDNLLGVVDIGSLQPYNKWYLKNKRILKIIMV